MSTSHQQHPALLQRQSVRSSRQQRPTLLLRLPGSTLSLSRLHSFSVPHQRLLMHTSRIPEAPRVKIRDEGPCPRHETPSIRGREVRHTSRSCCRCQAGVYCDASQNRWSVPPVIGFQLTWALGCSIGTSWPRRSWRAGEMVWSCPACSTSPCISSWRR